MTVLTNYQRKVFAASICMRSGMNAQQAETLVEEVCRRLENDQVKPLTEQELDTAMARAQREEAARLAACSAAHMMGIESAQANTIVTTYLRALELK